MGLICSLEKSSLWTTNRPILKLVSGSDHNKNLLCGAVVRNLLYDAIVQNVLCDAIVQNLLCGAMVQNILCGAMVQNLLCGAMVQNVLCGIMVHDSFFLICYSYATNQCFELLRCYTIN